MKDYYDVLGVPFDSTLEEIRKEYRKLMWQHHPDRGGNADLAAELTTAFAVIGDEIKRKAYDELGLHKQTVTEKKVNDLIASLLVQVINDDNLGPGQLLSSCVATVQNFLNTLTVLKQKLRSKISLLETESERITTTNEVNFIKAVIEWRIGELRSQLQKAEDQDELQTTVLHALQEYERIPDAFQHQVFVTFGGNGTNTFSGL